MPYIRPLILLTVTTAASTVSSAIYAAPPQVKVMRVAPHQPVVHRITTPVAPQISSPQQRTTTATPIRNPANKRRIMFQQMMAAAAMAAVSADLMHDPKNASKLPKPNTAAR